MYGWLDPDNILDALANERRRDTTVERRVRMQVSEDKINRLARELREEIDKAWRSVGESQTERRDRVAHG